MQHQRRINDLHLFRRLLISSTPPVAILRTAGRERVIHCESQKINVIPSEEPAFSDNR
jgi:hypothetical protein